MLPQIPPELLYKVVLFVATDYLDDLIAGHLSIPHLSLTVGHAQPGSIESENEVENIRKELQKVRAYDVALRAPNPLLPFLSASFQFRSTTLMVLSHLLGIGMVTSGIHRLKENPWTTRIHPTRLAYSNPHIVPLTSLSHLVLEAAHASPLLRAYQIVGCAETVLTVPQTYGIETMRRSSTTLMRVREEVVALRQAMDTRKSNGYEDEDQMSYVCRRLRRCDERSYAISVFTISLSLIRTNLCSIRRTLEMLRLDADIEWDPFAMSLVTIYQTTVALLLEDIAKFAKFHALVFVPSHAQGTGRYVPSYICVDDIHAACAMLAEIANLPAHAVYGAKYVECQEAAREVREVLLQKYGKARL